MPCFHRAARLTFCCLLVTAVGCATNKTSNTARTGTEQLLVSNAIDQSLAKVNFAPFRGQRVFLDTQYTECVDKPYLISSVRHRLLGNGVTLAKSADDADVVLELRAGAVGTDTNSSFIGMPEIALPGPMPVSLPEIKLLTRESQFGTAKIGLVAYEAKTRTALGDGGVTAARADDTNWFLLGMGPWRNGEVKSEIKSANEPVPTQSTLPRTVAFSRPGSGPNPSFDLSDPTMELMPASHEK